MTMAPAAAKASHVLDRLKYRPTPGLSGAGDALHKPASITVAAWLGGGVMEF